MTTVNLGSCGTFLCGGTPSKDRKDYWTGEIPWFSPKDFRTLDLDSAQDRISKLAISSSAAKLVPPGTILVVGRSGILAHTLPVGVVRQVSSFNQDIKAIIPNEDYDPEYIALFVKANQQTIITRGVKRGATVHSLVAGYLQDLPIPVYTLDRQKAIASKLRANLARAQSALAAANSQLTETAALGNSLILDSLRSGRTHRSRLGEALAEIKQGIGPSWRDYPVLGATRSGLAPAKERPGKNPDRYKPVFPGTVFYNPMRILIGSIAFVDDQDTPGITSPDYVVLKGKPRLVDSRWFYYWLRSPMGERFIQSLARGAVRERMLFNRLAEGEIELPDFAAQQRASLALARIKPVRAAIEKQIQELELIPQKLLAQVFES